MAALIVLLLTPVAYFLWRHALSPGALLISASGEGRTDQVSFLLGLGTSPNQFRGKWSPALRAAWNGHTPVLRLLAKHGARLDQCEPEGYEPSVSPVEVAAYMGHLETVRYLVATGVSVEHQCHESAPTPLQAAAEHDHADVVAALIELGANPQREVSGNTYLMLAASRGAASVLPLLIRSGCDVNAKRSDGKTALMMADEPQVVQALLHAGADVNARDQQGMNALLRLVEGAIWLPEHADVSPSPYNPLTLEALLRAGADPNTRSASGESPLDLASRTGAHRTQIERLLRQYGATR